MEKLVTCALSPFIQFRQISREWEREVGITDEDIELKNRIREIESQEIMSMKKINLSS